MFYEGDLRSGISLAISESKVVACFVRDDQDESSLWENDFLRDDELSTLLSTKTVLLRLTAGSEEAGFLGAICPLPKTPTFVVLQNGQLKEYLVSGITKELFTSKLKTVLRDIDGPSTAPAGLATGAVYPQTSSPVDAATSSAPIGTSTTFPEAQPQAVQDLLAERRTRLEAQKKKDEDAAKAKRLALAAERNAAIEANDPQKSAEMKYALLRKKRVQDARDERARILKLVEDDKIARREKEATRKGLAVAAASDDAETVSDPAELFSSTVKRPDVSRSMECAVQVRLFDGSTIRSRFPSRNTIREHVRKWVDSQRGDTEIPYSFKQILTPLPNRTIEISEEDESLSTLGLTPSVTLILVPIKDYTSAYEGGGATGLLSKGISAGYGAVSSGFGMVTGVLGNLIGSAPAAPQQPQETLRTPSPASSSVKVRTLRDQREPAEDQEFYNGNTLNFQPRKDDDDKKQD